MYTVKASTPNCVFAVRVRVLWPLRQEPSESPRRVIKKPGFQIAFSRLGLGWEGHSGRSPRRAPGGLSRSEHSSMRFRFEIIKEGLCGSSPRRAPGGIFGSQHCRLSVALNW